MTVKNSGLRETEGLKEIGVNNEIHTCNNDCQRPACVAVREAVAAEREACAKIAESYEPRCDSCPSGVANAIRGRGNNG
jgi:hypothetical protein